MITRKDIRSITGCEELGDETVKAILDKIHGEVDAVRDEKDSAQAQLAKVQKELETATTARDKAVKDLDDFKTAQASKDARAAKESAYTELLKEAGLGDKYTAKVLKLADLDSLEMDDKGKVKNAKSLIDSIKEEWPEFISEKKEGGAKVEQPPAGATGKAAFDAMSLSEKMAFANSHPAEFAEYMK